MMVCHVSPMAYKLEPMLYVVGENAMLNWNAKKYSEDQLRLAGGVGSRSTLLQRPCEGFSGLSSLVCFACSMLASRGDIVQRCAETKRVDLSLQRHLIGIVARDIAVLDIEGQFRGASKHQKLKAK